MTKNRYDGELGHFPLSWHKETCTLYGHFNHTHQPHLSADIPMPSLPIYPAATVTIKSTPPTKSRLGGEEKYVLRILWGGGVSWVELISTSKPFGLLPLPHQRKCLLKGSWAACLEYIDWHREHWSLYRYEDYNVSLSFSVAASLSSKVTKPAHSVHWYNLSTTLRTVQSRHWLNHTFDFQIKFNIFSVWFEWHKN